MQFTRNTNQKITEAEMTKKPSMPSALKNDEPCLQPQPNQGLETDRFAFLTKLIGAMPSNQKRQCYEDVISFVEHTLAYCLLDILCEPSTAPEDSEAWLDAESLRLEEMLKTKDLEGLVDLFLSQKTDIVLGYLITLLLQEGKYFSSPLAKDETLSLEFLLTECLKGLRPHAATYLKELVRLWAYQNKMIDIEEQGDESSMPSGTLPSDGQESQWADEKSMASANQDQAQDQYSDNFKEEAKDTQDSTAQEENSSDFEMASESDPKNSAQEEAQNLQLEAAKQSTNANTQSLMTAPNNNTLITPMCQKTNPCTKQRAVSSKIGSTIFKVLHSWLGTSVVAELSMKSDTNFDLDDSPKLKGPTKKGNGKAI